MDGLSEALDQFEKDVKLADSSPCGWTLIDRLKENLEDSGTRNIRVLEREILEERREFAKRKQAEQEQSSKKRSNDSKDVEMVKASKGSRSRPAPLGPCVWCGISGHGYAYCRLLQSDIEAGKAFFNPDTRKWERKTQQSGYV